MFRALHSSRTSQPPLAKTENSFTLTAKIEPQIGALTLELQTKVRENFIITEKGPMNEAFRHFQPGEGPNRDLLCDCEIFANLRLNF